ncbi:hypothetical protein Tco_1246969 [Tanacetum coccineum]
MAGGVRIGKGTALRSDEVIPQHTTQPLPADTPILEKSDYQKVVEYENERVLAAKRKAQAAKEKAVGKRQATGEGFGRTKKKKAAPLTFALDESDGNESNCSGSGTHHSETDYNLKGFPESLPNMKKLELKFDCNLMVVMEDDEEQCQWGNMMNNFMKENDDDNGKKNDDEDYRVRDKEREKMKRITKFIFCVKDKSQVGSLSPRKWRTRDMIVAAKHGDKVLNVQPVSEFNPTTGIQVLKPLVKKPLVFRDKVKDKASVKKPADVVEKSEKVKDKATIMKPTDVVEKPITVVVKDKVTVKKLAVVATVKKPANVVEKPAILTELPKLNASADVADKESDVVNNKDKESDVADKESDVVDKESDVDKDKFGANELLSDVVSKKRRRRTELPKPALKPAVKGNESKKLKSKSGMKRKMKNSSDSLSSSVDEKELRHLLKKLKNIKQEDSDESVSERKMKYKKKEKELTPSEAAHEEYLKHYPTLRARAVSIRFTTLPLMKYRQGWEGILMGGISLFSLEARPVEHEFVQSWVDQFYPKPLKKIQVGDIASKLIFAHEVDFLFKVNFLTLFTNTTGRVAGLKGEICLDVLLYFDSTKFDGVPVVRTRPAIRAWNSTLMRQREKLELDAHVLGLLELHDE